MVHAAFRVILVLVGMGMIKVMCAAFSTMRVYSSLNSPKQTRIVIAAVVAAGNNGWTLGTIMHNEGIQVPSFMISLRPFVVAWAETTNVQAITPCVEMKLTVVQPAWTMPLVNDSVPNKGKPKVNQIDALMRTSPNPSDGNLTMFRQTAIMPCVPANVQKNVDAVAARIISNLVMIPNDDDNGESFMARTVLICGPPAVGKSSVGRRVADLMDALLYTGYNPTRIGNCMFRVLADYDDRGIVFMCDEADLAMLAMMSNVAKDSEKNMSDAVDKASWNTLMDNMHYCFNIVLVLTTNLSEQEFKNLFVHYDPSGSMYRPGRIDEIITMDG
jgi:hypothetical protein